MTKTIRYIVWLPILFAGCIKFDAQPLKTPTVETFEQFTGGQQYPMHWEIYGVILSDGGSPILERGVTWSESSTPTANDPRTNDGPGMGTFLSAVSPDAPAFGISLNKIYNVRAYATNKVGTAYGAPHIKNLFFLLLTTANVTDITSSGARSGGTISSDGGAPVTARGVCWRTEYAGVIDDPETHFSSDGTGTGSFTSIISGLMPNTTYYVRAYAVNSRSETYGNIVMLTTPL